MAVKEKDISIELGLGSGAAGSLSAGGTVIALTGGSASASAITYALATIGSFFGGSMTPQLASGISAPAAMELVNDALDIICTPISKPIISGLYGNKPLVMKRYCLYTQSNSHLLTLNVKRCDITACSVQGWSEYVYIDLPDDPKSDIIAQNWRDNVICEICRITNRNKGFPYLTPGQFPNYQGPIKS